MESLSLTVDPRRKAAAVARESLLVFSDELDGNSLTSLRMVVSELVGLCVMHGASEAIDLQVSIHREEARGSIVDSGQVARAVIEARNDSSAYRALTVVEALVDEWGVSSDRSGLWFRMPVEAGA
jgi:hypothetical protein